MSTGDIYIERELLLRIAVGDEKAFYELFKVFTPMLRSYIWKLTRSETDTEEILQETFIRIWLHRDSIPAVNNLKAWIYTIAARICFSYLRKAFNQQKKIRELGVQSSYHNTEWNTPLAITQVEAIRRDIQKAVLQLTDKRRQIYRMNREEGLKPAAIAKQLGQPVGTIKNQLAASLRQIREYLIAAGHHISAILYILFKFF